MKRCGGRALSILLELAVLSLVGCAAGPDFHRPAAPAGGGHLDSREGALQGVEGIAAGQTQRFDEGADIPGDWWALFHSESLNVLIEQALRNNPDLKAAQAALAAARESALAQRGSFFPSISAGVAAARSKTSEQLSPTPNSGDLYFNLFTSQVGVSYVPDVFGLNRRTMEFAQAEAEQQRWALVATHLALSGNVAVAAVQEASLRAQIDAANRMVNIDAQMLEIVRTRMDRGYASRLDVAAQEAQLAQARQALPALQRALGEQRTLLAALVGDLPGDGEPPQVELVDLRLPENLPLSLPSQLIEQRPDIRQAEENLHAASAEVGIAVANRLPNFAITADIGSTALDAGRLFGGGTTFWDFGAGIAQPIFEGGALQHKERAARAAYIQAEEQYRGAVVAAFKNVADALGALRQDASALQAAAATVDAARATLELTRRQSTVGSVDTLAVLNAELSYRQAELGLAQAEASRCSDTAALFQALGGGWWHRAELTQLPPDSFRVGYSHSARSGGRG